MKRIRVMILTLVLSIAMLVPEFSMLPAVYAQDDASEVTAAADAGDVANSGESTTVGSVDNNEAAGQIAFKADAGDAATDAEAVGEVADAGDVGESASDVEVAGEAAGQEASVPDFTSYDKLYMTDLNEAGAIKFSPEMEGKITTEPAEYSKGLLFKGTVADLNSTYINLGYDFNFDEGSIGRITLDGLRDKDAGMTVEVEVYLDDCKSPSCTFALRKQMGKKEWANDGESTVSLGASEITGKHSVSLRLKISGKKDTAKTSVLLRSLQFCMSTVPTMYFNIDESEGTIDAMNNSSDHSVECYGTVDLVVPDSFKNDTTFSDEYGAQESQYGLTLEYIRGRGNSTWMDENKKPYKVKFDKAQDLFGFGKNKHWTLLANRYDNSLIRNRMTYWLGQQLGMEYTPQCVPVEVVMNGEFYGSYLLCEQIRVGTGRVTIDDLDDEDPLAITDPLIETGGYLLSLSSDADDKSLFTTENGNSFCIESPEDNVEYFSDYIKAFTQKVENAIFSESFRDENGNPYSDYLDMDAAVDYWWVQEFSCNGDAYGGGSTYLYKKRDSENGQGKLYWGPLWDFDYVAWGDLEYDGEVPAELNYTSHPWFDVMKSDAAFVEKVKARYSEEGGIRDKMIEITKEGGRLDKYLAQMETTYKYDHEKWGAYESEYTEYKDEIEQLRTWINQRIENVDKALNEIKVEDHTVTFVLDGKTVKTVTVHGFIFTRDFPEAPEKEGYRFEGWFGEDDLQYDNGFNITNDITLTGRYINEKDIPKPEKIFFKCYDVYTALESDFVEEGFGGYYMDYRVMPDDAETTGITWSSSNEAVATSEGDGAVRLNGFGDTTITATLPNGVSGSYDLHVVRENDLEYVSDFEISRTSLSLKVGGYAQLLAVSQAEKPMEPSVQWLVLDQDIATVDEFGIVEALKPGTTYILMMNPEASSISKCKLTVKSTSNKGRTVKSGGNTYKITSDKKGSQTAMLVKAKNAAKVTVPAFIKYDGKKYSVTKIKAKAFAKSKATKLVIKTKKLTKARVRNSLKGSRVRTIYVKVGKKSVNKTYMKKYKKIFTKANAGRKVGVK